MKISLKKRKNKINAIIKKISIREYLIPEIDLLFKGFPNPINGVIKTKKYPIPRNRIIMIKEFPTPFFIFKHYC